MKNLVSVIIPLYNKERTVARAVESVLNQSYREIELLIVDDGSTDKSCEIVAEKFDDSRLKIIHQKNSGPGCARNRGIKEAKGQFVAFLDADDCWYEDNLKNIVHWFDAHPDVNVAAAMYYEYSKQLDMASYCAKRGVEPGLYCISNDLKPDIAESMILFFHVGNAVVRSCVASKYGGFYEQRCVTGEDTIFFMRLLANEKFGILPTLAVCHHREESELSNRVSSDICPILVDEEIILHYCDSDLRCFMENVRSRPVFSAD